MFNSIQHGGMLVVFVYDRMIEIRQDVKQNKT